MGLHQRIVSPAVLGLLSADELLAEKWDEWCTPSAGTGPVANGRNWLPCYEAVLRKWTNNNDILKEIQQDRFFSQLLKAQVTFLDDSDFVSKGCENNLTTAQQIGKGARGSSNADQS